MNKGFLNRVTYQLIKETKIDYGQERVYIFSLLTYSSSSSPTSFLSSYLFRNHCEEVYGLSEEEIEYVWNEYKNIIKDKIKNEQRISK